MSLLTYSSTHLNASAGVVDLNVIMRIVMPVDDQASAFLGQAGSVAVQ